MTEQNGPILRCRAGSGDCPNAAAWRLVEDARLIAVTTELPDLICEAHAEPVRELLLVYTGELGGIGVRLVRIGESI